jgi:hypothetical protein
VLGRDALQAVAGSALALGGVGSLIDSRRRRRWKSAIHLIAVDLLDQVIRDAGAISAQAAYVLLEDADIARDIDVAFKLPWSMANADLMREAAHRITLKLPPGADGADPGMLERAAIASNELLMRAERLCHPAGDLEAYIDADDACRCSAPHRRSIAAFAGWSMRSSGSMLPRPPPVSCHSDRPVLGVAVARGRGPRGPDKAAAEASPVLAPYAAPARTPSATDAVLRFRPTGSSMLSPGSGVGRPVRGAPRSGRGQPPARQTTVDAGQQEVGHGVRDLDSPARLKVGEQVEPAGVIGAVVHPAQRQDAVGVLATIAARAARRTGAMPLVFSAYDVVAADGL